MQWKAVFFACVCFLLPAFGDTQDGDIQKVLKEMLLKQGKKELPPEIVKKSLSNFIEEFDPRKIYLLESESSPYETLNVRETETLQTAYSHGNFTVYDKLSNLFQQSVKRARNIRAQLYKEGSWESKNNQSLLYPEFSKNEKELKERWKQVLSPRFLGKPSFEWKTIQDKVEKEWQDRESDWLSVDEFGKEMPVQEIHSRFVVHVLKALAKGLDAHTSIYNVKEAEDLRMRLEKETVGIGIMVSKNKKDALVIRKIIAGGPAEKSRLLETGDEILEINQKKVEDESLDELLKELRGDRAGREVSLVIRKSNNGDRLVSLKLKTEEMAIQEGRVEVSTEPYLDGYIGRIVLHSFYQGEGDVSSEIDVKKAIYELEKKGRLHGLILDLRDNSGGFLMQAVRTAGLFITNGVVVISRYFNGEEQFYRDIDGKVVYRGPFVILVSRLTASAAEIVTQCLQDYGVAIVVGDAQTYGKGTIQSQNVTDKDKNTFFKVTVGKYYTVSGKTPQLDGVHPNILVPGPYNDKKIGEAFLQNPLPSDHISPTFNDELKDIQPESRAWYIRYYLPRLQVKGDVWQLMVPQLKEKSESRQKANKHYQDLLNIPFADRSPTDERQLSEMQLQEAFNIVKDMSKTCSDTDCHYP